MSYLILGSGVVPLTVGSEVSPLTVGEGVLPLTVGKGVLSLTVGGNVVSFTVDSIKLDPENLEIKHRIRFHQNEITKLKSEITKLKNETEWMQDLLFYQEQELEKELERLKEIEVKTLEEKLKYNPTTDEN